MIYIVGEGGVGKGMHAELNKSLFGSANFTSLDYSCFVDRGEMRKSGSVAAEKLEIRIQEANAGEVITSDIYKKFISGEEIDLRPNYGFTTKENFESSMKI